MTPDLWYALIPVTIFAIIIWLVLRKSGYCKYGCLARHAKPTTSKTTGGGRRNGRNGKMRRNHVTDINNHSKHRRDQDSGEDCDRISTISDGHCGYDGGDNGGGNCGVGGTGACDNGGVNTGGYSGGGDTGGGCSGGGGYSGEGGCDAVGDGDG